MGEGKIVARTYPAGMPIWERDATINDSDKSFTVPSRKRRRLLLVDAQILTSATVGNRYLVMTITDGTNIIYTSIRGAAIAASSSGAISIGQCYTAYLGTTYVKARMDSLAATVATQVFDMLPSNMTLLPGYVIRVFDAAAIDVAADDMTVVLHYEELDV